MKQEIIIERYSHIFDEQGAQTATSLTEWVEDQNPVKKGCDYILITLPIYQAI